MSSVICAAQWYLWFVVAEPVHRRLHFPQSPVQGDGDVALAQIQNGGDGAIGQAAAKFERDQVLLAFAECAQGFLELPVPLCIKILLFGIGIAAWRRCGSLQWGHFPMPIPAIVRDDGVASDAEEPRHKCYMFYLL